MRTAGKLPSSSVTAFIKRRGKCGGSAGVWPGWRNCPHIQSTVPSCFLHLHGRSILPVVLISEQRAGLPPYSSGEIHRHAVCKLPIARLTVLFASPHPSGVSKQKSNYRGVVSRGCTVWVTTRNSCSAHLQAGIGLIPALQESAEFEFSHKLCSLALLNSRFHGNQGVGTAAETWVESALSTPAEVTDVTTK